MSKYKNTFVDRVVATIEQNRLLMPSDKVIVGLSGGADSVALLAVLSSLGYDCVAAHCNFGLRGEESERDMRYVQNLCQQLNINLHVKRFDVAGRCSTTGESVEMACRELRYQWFHDLLTSERAAAVAVGHHREDNVETVLLNLFRGTGILGLCGINYRRDYIIRPLLDLTRAEIEDFLSERNLHFVVDSSNASDNYLRNRIRNHVIPNILNYFPKAEDAILTTARNIAASQRIYADAIDNYKRLYCNKTGDIDISAMHDALGSPKTVTVLFEMLKDYGMSETICRDIVRSAGQSGLIFKGRSDMSFRLDRGVLYIDTHKQVYDDFYPVDLQHEILSPVNIRISRHRIIEFRPEHDSSVAYLDISALKGEHSWAVRRWKKGDRLKPFGMNGSKLISDIFVSAKLNARQKSDTWILTCDDEPVWIVGLRASRLFQISPKTEEFLKLKLITNS